MLVCLSTKTLRGQPCSWRLAARARDGPGSQHPRAAQAHRVLARPRRDGRRQVAAARAAQHEARAPVERMRSDVGALVAGLADPLGARDVAGEDLLEQAGYRI